MVSENDKIEVELNDDIKGEIYYFESQTLKQLRFYPWIQLGIIILFLIIAYFLFSTFRKAEQNQVWAGMAKETAHQLGTPLSSLMAWVEIIKADGVPESSIVEMNKDIKRLETITDRFSKIGSKAKTKPQDVVDLISKSLEYLQSRVSRKVVLSLTGEKEAIAKLNEPLFEWVIENLTKNAVDAIQGEGSVVFDVSSSGEKVFIDVTDTGKGVPLNRQKSIFNPGYTTKERGWGLGLSLVKRIVEEQLEGKIFVKTSELNKGTTFRIIVNK
jgi:signal transduction histidine kinase